VYNNKFLKSYYLVHKNSIKAFKNRITKQI